MLKSRMLPALLAAAAVTLAACGTAIDGTAVAGARAPLTSSDAPTEADEPTTEDEQTDGEQADVDTELVDPFETEDLTPEPPIDPTDDPTDDPTGDISDPTDLGTGIDGQSIAWLSAWCTGVGDVMAYAGPDTTAMSDDATVQTVVDAYVAMSQVAAEVGYHLAAIPQPTFLGSEEMSTAVISWMFAIESVYGLGAEQIATSSFATPADLMDTIDSIEAGMTQPNAELGDAMALVDPAVGDTMDLMPECALITGE